PFLPLTLYFSHFIVNRGPPRVGVDGPVRASVSSASRVGSAHHVEVLSCTVSSWPPCSAPGPPRRTSSLPATGVLLGVGMGLERRLRLRRLGRELRVRFLRRTWLRRDDVSSPQRVRFRLEIRDARPDSDRADAPTEVRARAGPAGGRAAGE